MKIIKDDNNNNHKVNTNNNNKLNKINNSNNKLNNLNKIILIKTALINKVHLLNNKIYLSKMNPFVNFLSEQELMLKIVLILFLKG